MTIQGWKYYNHAAIPTTAPHEEVNMDPIEYGSIWNIKGALLARWTTNWDCKEATNWWYVIKDEPFDICRLKANYRYKINKGCRYFEVRVINSIDYIEEIYQIQVMAYSAYRLKSRVSVDKKQLKDSVQAWMRDENIKVFGGFFRETGELVGYILAKENKRMISLSVQKTIPGYEKYQLNAALVYGMLNYYEDKLLMGDYIVDGERNILHETQFQEYLEKYFGFRKAYCDLHILYHRKIKWAVKLLYPFRKFLMLLDDNKYVHMVNGVLKIEEIMRN